MDDNAAETRGDAIAELNEALTELEGGPPLKPALQTQSKSDILPPKHKKALVGLCCATGVALATGWRAR